MKVLIESRIHSKGQWWDIVTEHIVSDELSSVEKVASIKAIIGGLIATGSIIGRVGNNEVLPLQTPSHTGPGGEEATQSPLFTWPIPHCELHRAEMKVSTVQKDGAYSQFYCTQRMGQDYCKHRAKVDMTTGMPSFWEVK